MNKIVLCFLAGSVLFSWNLCCAAGTDAPPIDFKKALSALKGIKDKNTTDEKTMEGKFVQDLKMASATNASAIEFYKNAVKAMQFDGRDPVSFQNWLTAEDNKLNSEAMQTAVRLHISYLLLTIQRAQGANTKTLEPVLLAHIAAVNAAAAKDAAYWAERKAQAQGQGTHGKKQSASNGNSKQEPLFWEQDLINQDITSSIFLRWYGVQKMISDVKDWDNYPGDVEGIYQTTLLPYYRQIKDQRAVAYWDDKLQQEAQRASDSHLSFRIDQFNNVRRPKLLWNKAVDEIAIGQRNRGMSDMLEVVKSYPNHPETAGWVAQLEEMINNASATVTPAPIPAATPAASVAPAPTPGLVNGIPTDLFPEITPTASPSPSSK